MRRALITLALLALPLASLAEDAKKPDPETLGRRIREATLRAARAMAAQEKKDKPEYPTMPSEAGYKPLVALALVRAGGPEEKRVASQMLDAWWERAAGRRLGHSANYELSLAISALEGLSLERIDDPLPSTVTRYEAKPLDPVTKARLEAAVRALCVGRVLTDAERGCAWGYDVAPLSSDALTPGEPTPANLAKPSHPLEDPQVPPPGKGGVPTKTGPKGTTPFGTPTIPFDLSNSQFAILALHDASRAGIAIPRDVVVQMAYHLVESVQPDKKAPGFGYTSWYRPDPYSSMTFAGLSSLAIARELGLRDKQVDAIVSAVLAGIGDRIKRCGKLDWGGRHGWGLPYDLYSLEKALDLLEVGEVGGKDWFSPIAEQLLNQQGQDGLWDGEAIDTSFYVLFLLRATVGKARVVDHRTLTGKGGFASTVGQVYVAKRKATVDAPLAVAAVGSSVEVAQTRALANEAVEALLLEGHGREVCLLEPIADLLPLGGSKQEAGAAWLRELVGGPLKPEQARSAARAASALIEARENRDARALRGALLDQALVLPLRAFAASSLAALPCPGAVPEIGEAADRLGAEKALLATTAGARCARAYADALAALVHAKLPELPPKGPVSPDDLRASANEARFQAKKALEDAVAHALSAYPERERDRDVWSKARSDLEAQGDDGLARVLESAAAGRREKEAFAILHLLTGELIPDEVEAWRVYLAGRK